MGEGGAAGLPPSRSLPGDIGWKPDPDAVDRSGERSSGAESGDGAGAGRDDGRRPASGGPGLVLRLVSVVPFLIAGVVGVIALVGWALLFVFGFGDQEAIWEWASGRPAGEVAVETLLVLALGLSCVALTVLAMWAGLHGFRPESGVVFWTVAQVVFGLLAIGMVVADRLAGDAVADAGLSAAEWWVLFAGVALSMVVARLRARAVPDTVVLGDDGDRAG